MKKKITILISICLFLLLFHLPCKAQELMADGRYMVEMCEYQGEMIPCVQLPTVYIFPPLIFHSERERQEYNRLVYNIKKVYPISVEINNAIIETYEYLQTLPDKKSRDRHIKLVEKGLKAQYTARMKKLTFTQGKLLIKLVDRQSNQTSYEVIRAFMGPFKAGLYQAFACLFGASLKKQYHPEGEDRLMERVVLMVSSGEI